MENKFSDGSTSGYQELPVPFAWLNWTRGEAKLAALKDTDPGAYFGGWRAFVTSKDKTSNEERENPKLPMPIVTRVSEDGKHQYRVYASNVIDFLPIQHRTRFELREKATDMQTGREYQKLVAVSQEKRQGYAPCRQIFGLVFNGTNYAPAVLVINKWSAFISINKAGEKWNKIKIPAGQVLVRRYGSIGTADGMPNFEVFGQGRSTPIDAIGLDKPSFIAETPELNDLYDKSLAWKNCEKWNAEGKADEPEVTPLVQKFNAACEEIGLSNIEIEQLVKESGGSIAKALQALVNEPTSEEVNTALSDTDISF
jgi:hypothetical protein